MKNAWIAIYLGCVVQSIASMKQEFLRFNTDVFLVGHVEAVTERDLAADVSPLNSKLTIVAIAVEEQIPLGARSLEARKVKVHIYDPTIKPLIEGDRIAVFVNIKNTSLDQEKQGWLGDNDTYWRPSKLTMIEPSPANQNVAHFVAMIKQVISGELSEETLRLKLDQLPPDQLLFLFRSPAIWQAFSSGPNSRHALANNLNLFACWKIFRFEVPVINDLGDRSEGISEFWLQTNLKE